MSLCGLHCFVNLSGGYLARTNPYATLSKSFVVRLGSSFIGTAAGRFGGTPMMRFVLATVALGVAAAIGYSSYPQEFRQGLEQVIVAGRWLKENIQANPLPLSLAVGTFLLTVIYHKAKGKSLRESVEVAATRVTIVPVSFAQTGQDELPVVKRARARAMRSQLIADQIGLQNRQRKLPEEVQKAEKDACYTEQAVADAERKLADKQKTHGEAVAKLAAIRKEKTLGDAELAEIDVELKKLAELA